MFENTEITLERIKLPTFILCLNDETLLILLETFFFKLLRQHQLSYSNNLTVLIILANASLPNGTTD